MRKTMTQTYSFSSPSAAHAAAQVIEAQLKPFKKVKSEVKTNDSTLTILIAAKTENISTAQLCAKRLAEWMNGLQSI